MRVLMLGEEVLGLVGVSVHPKVLGQRITELVLCTVTLLCWSRFGSLTEENNNNATAYRNIEDNCVLQTF